jgi:hypothetical protein
MGTLSFKHVSNPAMACIVATLIFSAAQIVISGFVWSGSDHAKVQACSLYPNSFPLDVNHVFAGIFKVLAVTFYFFASYAGSTNADKLPMKAITLFLLLSTVMQGFNLLVLSDANAAKCVGWVAELVMALSWVDVVSHFLSWWWFISALLKTSDVVREAVGSIEGIKAGMASLSRQEDGNSVPPNSTSASSNTRRRQPSNRTGGVTYT